MTVNRTSVKQKNVGLFPILKWQFFYITDSFVFSDLIPFDIVSCAIMRIQSQKPCTELLVLVTERLESIHYYYEKGTL